MRNILIGFIMLLPILLTAQKKQRDTQLFVGYLAAGMNVSQIAGDRMAGYRKVGANAGVGTYIMYKPFFSNSIEISYSMKGSQEAFKNNNPTSFKKYTMDYVEIPVLFNYHEKEVAIFSAGITFGRLIRNEAMNAISLVSTDPKKWEFGITAGGTFIVKKRFGFNLKVNYSLNSILASPDPASKARRNGWYHNALTFRFVYMFKKKEDKGKTYYEE